MVKQIRINKPVIKDINPGASITLKERKNPKVRRSFTVQIIQFIMVLGPSGKDRLSIEALPMAGAEHITGSLSVSFSWKKFRTVLPALKLLPSPALFRIAAPSSQRHNKSGKQLYSAATKSASLKRRLTRKSGRQTIFAQFHSISRPVNPR